MSENGTATSEAPRRAGSHERVLDDAFGLIFAVFTVSVLLQVAGTLLLAPPGEPTLLLLLLVAGISTAAAVRGARGGFERRLAVGLFLTAGTGLVAAQLLEGLGRPDNAAVLLVNLPAVAAAALFPNRWFAAPVALVLIVSRIWAVDTQLPIEQAATTLATFTLVAVATTVMRRSARRADAALAMVHRELAETAVRGEALRYRQEAARRVHDDVLSVVKLLSLDRPWTREQRLQLAAQAREALQAGPAPQDVAPPALSVALAQLTEQSSADVRFVGLGPTVEPPASVVLAIVGAAAEALRNVDLHAGSSAATLTLSGGPGPPTEGWESPADIVVTVTDSGRGFEARHIEGQRRGLRDSVGARMEAVGGHAEIRSSPGAGTSVRLLWTRAGPKDTSGDDGARSARGAAPPMLWLSGLRFTAGQVMAGFFLAPFLSFLILFWLHLDDVRLLPATVSVVGLVLTGVWLAPLAAALDATSRQVAVGLVAALGLTALGILAVRPGTTDGFAYWASGLGSIPLAGVAATVGPRRAAGCLAVYLVVLASALVLSRTGLHPADAVGVLGAPPVAVAFIAGLRLGFQRHEQQLQQAQTAELESSTRLASAEAVAAADEASVAGARELCEPLLQAIAADPAPDDDALRLLARSTLVLLRQDLTAPRLTADLLQELRCAVDDGADVMLVDSREHDGPLTARARELLHVVLDSHLRFAKEPTSAIGRLALWLEETVDEGRSSGTDEANHPRLESMLLRFEGGTAVAEHLCATARRSGLGLVTDGTSVTVTASGPGLSR